MRTNGNEIRDIEQNKAFVQDVLGALSRGDWERMEDAFAEDAVVWVAGAMSISGTHTKAFVTEADRRTRAFFPDGLSLVVKAMTAEGDRVAIEAESLNKHTSGKIYNNHFHRYEGRFETRFFGTGWLFQRAFRARIEKMLPIWEKAYALYTGTGESTCS